MIWRTQKERKYAVLRTSFALLAAFTLLFTPPTRAAEPAASVTGRHGMVVSTQSLASQVGAAVLRKGGNAIDAAVAVGYALAVVHPAAGNIGGGGFMTIRFADGRTRFLDFRERAPGAATPTMFQDADGTVIPALSNVGYLAVGVPGTVRGLSAALADYGTRPLAELIAPSIRLAEKGFTLRHGDIDMIATAAPLLAKDPAAAVIFLRHGLPKPGARLRQKQLAATLRLIAEQGPDAFYRGRIADAIVAASTAHRGVLQKSDFENYQMHQRDPITCQYRGFDITTAAPPSSGGITLCEALNILEGYDLAALGYHSAGSLHVIAEAMRLSFFDRNKSLGDPDFVVNPSDHLLDKGYAAELRGKIAPDRATPSLSLGSVAAPPEGRHTTDYVVVDQAGTAVSVVYTLNDWFGAKVVAGDTGILLNNEMDDFAAKPGEPNEDGLVTGDSNAIRPGKAPLSSMAPTIMAKDGQTLLTIGSFGSGTIITSILQAIVNLVDYHMTLSQAIDAPRIHQQWLPDSIAYDAGAFDDATALGLREMGYSLSLGTQSGAS